MSQLYLTRHLRYLVDPRTGADLLPQGAGLVSADEHYYDIQDEVLCLASADLSVVSAMYDEKCRQQGRKAPDAAEFMALPRQGLAGWGINYWDQRALSLAGVWQILEAERRRQRKRCVGFQGVAAALSPSLPYLAYGLEVGGYSTYALSPHRGAYGLGAYTHGRYCRVQASWDALPLRPNSFDVVILTEVLGNIDRHRAERILTQCVGLLVKKGLLFITDTPEVNTYSAVLKRCGLKVQIQAVRGLEDKLGARVMSLLGQGLAVPPVLVAHL